MKIINETGRQNFAPDQALELSSPSALPRQVSEREEILHYLVQLEASRLPPPRDKATQEAIWGGLSNGTFQVFSSDHAPYRYDETGEAIPWPQS